MLEAALEARVETVFHDNGRRDLEKAFRDCESRLGRPATNLEICEELGLGLKELYSLLDLQRGIGLGCMDDYEPVSETETGQLIKYVPDPSAVECFSIYPKAEFRYALAQAIETLPKNEKLVVSLHHNEELSMQEIAKIFGISETRVAQIHTTAMLRIRGKLHSLVEV